MVAHAIVVPYPGQGHMNPMMQLVTRLASNGITVTIVLTQSWHKILTQVQDNVFVHAQNLGLPIRPELIPNCVVEESERWGNMTEFLISLANMEPHVAQVITNLNQSGSSPTCLVADAFLKWAIPFAKREALLSLSLWPMSVTTFSVFSHLDSVGVEGCIDYIPGLPPFQRTDIPSILTFPTVKRGFAVCVGNVREADWFVANSFYALDCKAAEALRHETPVQCVGPLLPSAYLHQPEGRDRKEATTSRVEAGCTQWLDSKQPRSVIYVSFGSYITVSRPQMWEIAHGLMASGYCFLWALRPDKEASQVSEMLPPGFMEEGKEQGVVVPWFNQMEILSHPSIGGFLSHCGWNAVMESILSGVPMLGFPLALDQFINCKMVVDEWKFGLRLRNTEDENRVIAREEIGSKVKMLMEGEESVTLRKMAERFKELAKEEVTNEGGSATNLEAIADKLKEATKIHE